MNHLNANDFNNLKVKVPYLMVMGNIIIFNRWIFVIISCYSHNEHIPSIKSLTLTNVFKITVQAKSLPKNNSKLYLTRSGTSYSH